MILIIINNNNNAANGNGNNASSDEICKVINGHQWSSTERSLITSNKMLLHLNNLLVNSYKLVSTNDKS